MSKMGQLLDKRLDGVKYDMYAVLKLVELLMRDVDRDWAEAITYRKIRRILSKVDGK